MNMDEHCFEGEVMHGKRGEGSLSCGHQEVCRGTCRDMGKLLSTFAILDLFPSQKWDSTVNYILEAG